MDKRFMLVSFAAESGFIADLYPTYERAFASMKKEMCRCGILSDEALDDWGSFGDYGVAPMSGWVLDNNNNEIDWRIYDLEDM